MYYVYGVRQVNQQYLWYLVILLVVLVEILDLRLMIKELQFYKGVNILVLLSDNLVMLNNVVFEVLIE